jgi:UDP-N-acetylglucosamine 2-epimerase (non-hydrolysing)
MRILVVVGTRPEVIKMAPIVQEVRRRQGAGAPLELVVCSTGQHRELVDSALAQFGIAADHDLQVMAADQTPTQVVAAAMSRMEAVLAEVRPDWMLVEGDTSTAVAAGLAAFYRRCAVAHVEAGLRSHDRWRPFPEEVNRRVVGVVADLHLAPTAAAARNLLREGVDAATIAVTGNTVIDAVRWVADQPAPAAALELLGGGAPRRVVLVTAHRRESFGPPLVEICAAVAELARRYADAAFVLPVHPNPSVRGVVTERLRGIPNVRLCDPLDYFTLVHVMKGAAVVLTDSGGIQEEAPALGKPVLVLRDVTERPEAVSAGTAKLVGPYADRIVFEATRLFEDGEAYARMARAVSPYGDGQAAPRIVARLLGEPFVPFAYEAEPLEAAGRRA